MPILPPGISDQVFSATLDRFRDVVGTDWVFSSDEDVALYRDAFSVLWGEPEERLASAAVAPADVEQVQGIVRICNENSVPVFPISTGKNLAYGGSAPNMSGSVILDMKRMNGILEVDDKRHYALVEPGVSYFDLYRHIQENELSVWLDCPDPGWGSLVGNALDLGIGYTTWPFRDHFGVHSGMEVVLPDGELMRTGMGALPGSVSWQDYRYGFGPQIDGLFAQGSCGVVTKMGFWLMPEPEAYLRGYVDVPRRRDFIPLVEQVNYLENLSLVGHVRYESPLGSTQFRPPLLNALQANPFPPDEQLDGIARQMNVPFWRVELQFYGSLEGVRANWQYAQRRIGAAIPAATFEEGDSYTFPLTAEQIEAEEHKVALGIPNLSIWEFISRDGRRPVVFDGHMDFSCVIPRSGEEFLRAQKVFHEATRDLNTRGMLPFGPFTLIQSSHPRNFLYLAILPTSRTDAAINRNTRAIASRLIEVAAENGWGLYRATTAFQDKVMGTYSFNNHALRNFQERIKDAIDPNGIIAPGRGGVWPQRYRSQREENA